MDFAHSPLITDLLFVLIINQSLVYYKYDHFEVDHFAPCEVAKWC